MNQVLTLSGNMMPDSPLIADLLDYAADHHGNQKIVSRRLEGDIHTYTYKEARLRSKKLANALIALGAKAGDRVGTLAWNGYRHFEAYYAISGIGAVCHTVNPRLYEEQIEYIINHAEDTILLVDACFSPLLVPIITRLNTVKHIIWMIDLGLEPEMTVKSDIAFHNYEALLETSSQELDWPRFDPNSAACLCYTSGTTGNPKGVLYSHTSTVLHAYASRNPDGLNIGKDTSVMPVVPMYHVCAWGMPYIAPMAGAKLVLPGSGMEGADLYELIHREQIDTMLGVPTVWLRLLEYLDEKQLSIASVNTVGVGGAASPLALVEALDKKHNVYLMPIWGMTETSPLATFAARTEDMDEMTDEERYRIQTSAGRPMFGIKIEIFDDDGQPLPHDGETRGFLRVRGPWVLNAYYKEDKPEAFVTDNKGTTWFDTGDIAVIDPKSYLRIVDRAKEVVKSGGEWISSIDLENAALGHDAVAEACVIGVKHEQWDERPLLFVVTHAGTEVDKQSIYDFLADKVAKWWLPDDILFVKELPHTATGKLQKRTLRDQYFDYLIKAS